MRNTTLSAIFERLCTAEEYLIFSIGDSITEGARASSDETTYTAVLTKLLAKRLPDRTVIRYDGRSYNTPDSETLPLETHGTPIVVQQGSRGKLTVSRCGIGGNSTRRLLRRRSDFIGKKLEGRTGDLFMIVVGINDSIEKVPDKFATPEQYTGHLHVLLDSIEAAHPDADIILMTPTYYDRGTERKSCLDPYADAMKAVASERNVPMIDLHRLWMDHMCLNGENYGQGSWLNGDRCHPSDEGHAAIAHEIMRCLMG